jgi:acrylyl-CoA reductase (NADPH)
MVRSLLLSEGENGISAAVESVEPSGVGKEGEICIRVFYSSLNYKDALAVTGEGRIIRGSYPFVPGIDLVGEVIESRSERFRVGDRVIGTGGGLGETLWGGYAERVTVPDRWIVSLPETISPFHAMVIGTAGLTAMLSVIALEPLEDRADEGSVVVTGATGGVGSLSTFFLSRSGYRVTASTGNSDHTLLRSLGATSVIDRKELESGFRQALDSARWLGAVDSVGGSTLATILSQTSRHGHVASCGLVAGHELCTTVFPFILRGVTLHGIDSNTCPITVRNEAWRRIGKLSDESVLDSLADTITLEDIPERARALLGGHISGRTVVSVDPE